MRAKGPSVSLLGQLGHVGARRVAGRLLGVLKARGEQVRDPDDLADERLIADLRADAARELPCARLYVARGPVHIDVTAAAFVGPNGVTAGIGFTRSFGPHWAEARASHVRAYFLDEARQRLLAWGVDLTVPYAEAEQRARFSLSDS